MSYEEFKKKKLGKIDVRAEYVRLSRQRALMYSVAQQIKARRLKLGLTQENLAALVGTHQSGIARLENGSTLPSLSFLFIVADALKCDIKFSLPEHQTSKDVSKTHSLKPSPPSSTSFVFVEKPNEANFELLNRITK